MSDPNPGSNGNTTKKSLTGKGTLWELAHSWWILLTFSIFFYWVPFLYIGLRTKQKKWWLAGLIYAIPFVLIFAIHNDSALFGVAVGLSCVFEVVSVVHAFRARREFLLRLAALSEVDKRKRMDQLAAIELEYGVDLDGKGTGDTKEPPRTNSDRQSSQQVITPDSKNTK